MAAAARRQAEAAPRGRGRPAELARRAEMAELWAAGLTQREIADRDGVSRQAVAAALAKVEAADGEPRPAGGTTRDRRGG